MQPTSPPQFDPSLIERYAEQLYRKADSVRVGSAVAGAVLGIVFGAVPLSPLGKYLPVPSSYGLALVMLGALVGGFLGYVVGEGRAFRIRLQAQMVLFQLQIERNTHQGAQVHAAAHVAPPAPAAAPPAPAAAPPAPPAPAAAPPAPVPVPAPAPAQAVPQPAPVVAASRPVAPPPPAPVIPVQPAQPAVAAAASGGGHPTPHVPVVPSAPQPMPYAVQSVPAPRPLQAVPAAEHEAEQDELVPPPLLPPLSP